MSNTAPANDVERIRAIVATILDRFEDPSDADIAAECLAHPHLESKVRSRLAILREAGLLASDTQQGIPARLGDFRLIELLGSGGMGVVYRAEQESLGREVALKLVRPENLFFPGARDRFDREVRAIAKLDHPGIVKIHSFGEENGVPYFAMERVRGVSLAEVLEHLSSRRLGELCAADLGAAVRACLGGETSTPERAAPNASASWVRAGFELVAQVAQALAHAHERGVLHRDVKPSNIMVTVDGRALLLDFGLARSEHAGKLTQSGSPIGSLPYMAPEQVQGDRERVGVRTDVYGLGVTLYEILALQSPYHDATITATHSRIIEGSPVPPSHINPGVAWDAETVCLTAMDRAIERRYADMHEFAADLRNFLEHRPIVAKRPGPFLRVKRAAQRHPARAGSLAVALLLLLVGSPVWALVAHAKNQELAAAHRRAEQSLRSTVETVSRMLTRIAESRLANEAFMTQLRADVLDDAVQAYERIALQEPRDVGVRLALVEALIRIGDLRRVLHRLDAAASDYERAIARCEAVRSEVTHVSVVDRELARAWFGLGSLHRAAGRLERARAAWTTSRGYLETWLSARGHDERAACMAAERAYALAVVDAQLGRFDNGQEGIWSAIEMLRALPARTARVVHTLARGHEALGSITRMRGAPRAACTNYAKSLDLLEEAVGPNESSNDLNKELAKQTYNFASLLNELGRKSDAKKKADRAIELMRALWHAQPGRVDYKAGYARSLTLLASICIDRKPRLARPLLAEATRHQQALRREHPNVEWLEDLALSLGLDAHLHAVADQRTEARTRWIEAIDIWEEVVRLSPNRTASRFNLGKARNDLAVFEEWDGNTNPAVLLLEAAREDIEAALGARDHPRMRALLEEVRGRLQRLRIR